MAAGLTRPRPEDFGLDDEALRHSSRSFVAEHRCGLLLALIGSLILALFVAAYLGSGSVSAAAFFALVLGLASLVVILPLLTIALAAACAAQERWRGRRDPTFRACAAYRAAMTEFDRLTSACQRRPPPRLDPSSFRAEAARRLQGSRWEEVSILDRASVGADLLARGAAGSLVVRCVPGPDRAALADARELLAARLDLGASSALLVSALTVDEPVRSYLARHGIDVEELRPPAR